MNAYTLVFLASIATGTDGGASVTMIELSTAYTTHTQCTEAGKIIQKELSQPHRYLVRKSDASLNGVGRTIISYSCVPRPS